MVHAISQSDQLQRRHHVIAPLLRIQLGQQQRQLHVLKRGQHRDQIERLEHVPDVLVPPARRLRIVEAEDVLAHHQQFARGRTVDGRNHVQQRRLARSRGPHQREELSLRDVDGDVVERGHLESVALENFADVASLHDLGSGGDVRIGMQCS